MNMLVEATTEGREAERKEGLSLCVYENPLLPERDIGFTDLASDNLREIMKAMKSHTLSLIIVQLPPEQQPIPPSLFFKRCISFVWGERAACVSPDQPHRQTSFLALQVF